MAIEKHSNETTKTRDESNSILLREGDASTALEVRQRQLAGLSALLTLDSIRDLSDDGAASPQVRVNVLELVESLTWEIGQLLTAVASAPAR